MERDETGLDTTESADLPPTFRRFIDRFPDIAAGHQAMGKAGDAAGPLDRKMVELIKLGICVGAGLESATKSHARRAIEHGATREEVEQAAVLAVNPVGLPRAVMAWQWATEQMERE
jgi:4-carboxymuconolactone decarboxylase